MKKLILLFTMLAFACNGSTITTRPTRHLSQESDEQSIERQNLTTDLFNKQETKQFNIQSINSVEKLIEFKTYLEVEDMKMKKYYDEDMVLCGSTMAGILQVQMSMAFTTEQIVVINNSFINHINDVVQKNRWYDMVSFYLEYNDDLSIKSIVMLIYSAEGYHKPAHFYLKKTVLG